MSLQVSYSKQTDSDIWADFKAGDKNAFSFLYYKHINSLLDYALKFTRNQELVEDAVHELFFELWQKRATLADVQAIRNYLFACLRRKLLKHLKVKKVVFDSELVDEASAFDISIESVLIADQEALERKEKLSKIIETLSPLQKEIIYLRYYNSFSFDEIADMLKTDKKSVYNALSKAMIRLRKSFMIPFYLISLI